MLSRRTFLHTTSVGVVALLSPPLFADTPRSRPPARKTPPGKKLAVVTTAYHYLSHAYHICGRFLHGYLRCGRFHHSNWHIAGMHVEQHNHKGDMSQELSRQHKFALYRDVAGALTLGGKKLAVDG